MLQRQEDIEVSKVEALMPSFDMESDNKRDYLKWRMCGFSRKEAQERTGIQPSTVKDWEKKDKVFEAFNKESLQSLSQKYRGESVVLEFTRNLMTALAKDAQVMDKSLDVSTPLTSEEWDYLKKVRPMYTPANLKILEDMVKGDDNKQAGSWDEILIIARRNANAQGRNSEQLNENEIFEFASDSSLKELTEGSYGSQS